jgi:hypothetical protein
VGPPGGGPPRNWGGPHRRAIDIRRGATSNGSLHSLDEQWGQDHNDLWTSPLWAS